MEATSFEASWFRVFVSWPGATQASVSPVGDLSDEIRPSVVLRAKSIRDVGYCDSSANRP